MTKNDLRFLSLLQAGLWGTAPDITLFDKATDWDAILRQARRQTVSPIVFDGMSMLPKELQPQQEVAFQWFADVMRVEKQNALLNKTSRKLIERYQAIGLSPIIIKGQSLAQLYRNPLRRTPGDIDLYFPTGYDRANQQAALWTPLINQKDLAEQEFVVQLGYTLPNNVVVENHREYAFFFSKRRARLWKSIEKEIGLTAGQTVNIEGRACPVLSPTLNALYVFQHLLRHLLSFGVGFRQVCDWAVLCSVQRSEIDPRRFRDAAERLSLLRPITALARIAEEHLGIERGVFPFDTKTEQAQRDAQVMLDDILTVGNFGHDTEAMEHKDSLHLARKLRSYRLIVARFFRLSRFGSREVVAACRFFIAKNWKKTFRYFHPRS